MGVPTDEERPVEALRGAVVDDGLRRGEDVVLVEGGAQARATVARRAERDLLVGVVDVRVPVVVGADEGVDVDEVLGLGGLTGARVGHEGSPFVLVTAVSAASDVTATSGAR